MTLKDKVVINIFGPSTAGKSTIADLLRGEIDRLYTVDFDIVKRQLSGYYWKRDREITEKISLDTLMSAANSGLPIVALLPPSNSKEAYRHVEDIAKNFGYVLINVEITAPEDVLVERYRERLERIKASGTNSKFKTLEEFKHKLREPYYGDPSAVSFDSSILTPQEILSRIKSLLMSEVS